MSFYEIEKIWPDWRAVRLIGEGSFGKVYEIVRSNFGIEEHCALKVISIPSSEAELESMRSEGMDEASTTEYYKGLVGEFVQEISLMAQLKGHTNVVAYEDYAVVEHQDTFGWDILIRMELLTPLPAYIRTKSLTAADVLKLGIDICGALDMCCNRKIIHRDIKPDNIFVSQNGDFKLGDFGVARTIEKTVSGLSKKGTYTYMAPEVYKGEPYGANVDLYSLGVVMYKLLNNNREPFLLPYPEVIKYSDKNSALSRRLNGEMIPPPANCAPFFSKVILKALGYHPWDRYQQPAQMQGDLLAIKKSMATGVLPVLHADHLAASGVHKTDPNSQTKSNTPVFVFGENSQVQNKTAELSSGNKALKITALILGWIGAIIWFFVLFGTDPLLMLATLAVVICMILLSIKKLFRRKTIFSICMLIFSLLSINILCIPASILFLLIKSPKQ